jgi:ribosomal protein S14
MKYNTIKNLKFRANFSKKEFLLITHKFFKINLFNNYFFTKNTNKISNFLIKKNESKVKIKNKCIFTGCNNSVNKSYNISRVKFRKLLQFGIISNYTKAVW